MISIIIPMYNEARSLTNMLESLLKQTYQDFEVLMINDGSTDETGKVALAFTEKDVRFQYLEQENKGVSAARNLGIAHSEGEYIAFFDADDHVDPKYLEIMLKPYEQNSQIHLVACGYYKGKQKFELTEQITNSEWVVSDMLTPNSIRGYLWNKLFLRQIIIENGLKMNEEIHFGEDLLFCFSYLMHTDSVSYLSSSLYHYNPNNDSITNFKFTSKTVTLLHSLDRMIKEMYEKKLEIQIINQYITYQTRVAMSLWRHGRNIMNSSERHIIENILKKNRFSQIIKPVTKIKLALVRLSIYFRKGCTLCSK